MSKPNDGGRPAYTTYLEVETSIGMRIVFCGDAIKTVEDADYLISLIEAIKPRLAARDGEQS